MNLAHDIHGIASLCLGDHGQGLSAYSSLLKKPDNHPKGWFTWKKWQYRCTLFLGDDNLHKVPQTIACSALGP